MIADHKERRCVSKKRLRICFFVFFPPKYAANLVSRASSSVTPSPPFRTGKKCRILKRKKYPFFLFSLFISAQPVEVTSCYFKFSFLPLPLFYSKPTPTLSFPPFFHLCLVISVSGCKPPSSLPPSTFASSRSSQNTFYRTTGQKKVEQEHTLSLGTGWWYLVEKNCSIEKKMY